MTCRRCKSENISVQQVAITKTKGRGWLYWLFWVWFDMLIWLFMFLPRLILGLLRKTKIKTKIVKMATCQDCGNSWRVRF